MSYISDNYDVSKKYNLAISDFSPYIECFPGNEPTAEVNGLFRFADLFQKLFSTISVEQVNDEEIENAISTLFHILANYDFLAGICENDIACLSVEKEIMNGMYGPEVKTLFEDFNYIGKIRLLEILQKRKTCHGRESFIFDVLKTFMCADLQFYSAGSEEFIVYIPMYKKIRHVLCQSMDNEAVLEILKFFRLQSMMG